MIPAEISWHSVDVSSVLDSVESAFDGLSQQEAETRLIKHGLNILPPSVGEPSWLIFWRQINNPIGWLLIAAGTLALIIGKYSDSVVVFGAVVINAVIGFVQEYRAGKAIQALSALVPRNAMVVRDGYSSEIASSELVPGDVVVIQSGDQIPADMRLFRVKNLQVDESALTGESLPVMKRIEPVATDAALGDRFCMVYSGTMVVQGTASGVVIATAGTTELGRINTLINQTTELETPLTRQLTKVSNWITVATVIIVAILLGVGILVRHAPVGEALLVAVSLAAAAIPEGLPAVITIALSIGVRRMAARNAVVRQLPAVETLGSTTVICSDKTGTLTRNEMTVQVLWQNSSEYRLSGVGYSPFGDLEHDGHRLLQLPDSLKLLLEQLVLCNDASLRQDGDVWSISGDPTEAAMVVAARKAGYDEHALRMEHERIDVVPFESETQFMATLNDFGSDSKIILKGAPEQIIKRCSLKDVEKSLITDAVETYARQGMRVIACASGSSCSRQSLEYDEIESGFVFSGLVGMIDPAREEAIEAIKRCHTAGITVKMITGDHPVTAAAIGVQLGILKIGQAIVQGHDLDSMPDKELLAAVSRTNVFARVAPEHKIRLVRALQELGEVVAMTGDGVNDAPALKQADIGIAMGITGTAVSKEAAKVILVDDNFASIAAAVEEGRRVYDNLLKSLAFILPTNLGLACILSVAMFFFPKVQVDGVHEILLSMSPSQTLWINLVASITLSVPLAFEPLEPGSMGKDPRSPEQPVFSGFIIFRLILVAGIMASVACGLFLLEYFRIAGEAVITAGLHKTALAEAQTTCVTAVVFTQIFYLLNCRSLRNSQFSQGFFSNPSIFIGAFILLLLQICFCYLPPMQKLFNTVGLDAEAWLHAALAGSIVMPVIALEKSIMRWCEESKHKLKFS